MQCARVFDTYIRDIDIDPTGTYFVVSTTGAFNGGLGSNTLCDIDHRGGSSAAPAPTSSRRGSTTRAATRRGASPPPARHLRRRPLPVVQQPVPRRPPRAGRDEAPRHRGASTRTPACRSSWNPGRCPGEGAFILYSTADGLWVGHDTNQIGGEYHPRLTFFPLAGRRADRARHAGDPAGQLWTLPNDGGCRRGRRARALPRERRRPGAAVDRLWADWSADNGASSPYRNSGSSTNNYFISPPIDSTVPSHDAARGVPHRAVDDPQRAPGDAVELPRPERDATCGCGCTSSDRSRWTRKPGTARFNVQIEGTRCSYNFDANAAVGHNRGTMRAFDVTSDGTDHDHVPARRVERPPDQRDRAARPGRRRHAGLHAVDVGRTVGTFDGSTAGARTLRTSSIDWSHARGAFYANGRIYYGWDDGKMYRRNFNGATFGPRSVVQTNDLSPVYFPVPLITGMFLPTGGSTTRSAATTACTGGTSASTRTWSARDVLDRRARPGVRLGNGARA